MMEEHPVSSSTLRHYVDFGRSRLATSCSFLGQVLLAIGVFAILANSLAAQSAEFIPLGHIPGGFASSFATDVSADGNVVVGRSHSPNGSEAFRWTLASGMLGLGDLPDGDTWSSAAAVSRDGSIIIGRGTVGVAAGVDAFRWTEETGPTPIGYLPREGLPISYPGAISDNGKVIGGSSANRAFVWTEDDGIQVLPGISDSEGSSGVAGISADGSVIAGSRELEGVRQPYLYTSNAPIQDLGLLAGRHIDTFVNGLSSNGKVVIGNASGRGWRWDAARGMHPIPFLQENDFAIYPIDLTADGSVIVGTTHASTDPTERFPSFIWTQELGTQNLEAFLSAQYGLSLDGWSLSRVSGISDDGHVIVGGGVNPQGQLEAWAVVIRVPETSALCMLLIGVFSSCAVIPRIAHHCRL